MITTHSILRLPVYSQSNVLSQKILEHNSRTTYSYILYFSTFSFTTDRSLKPIKYLNYIILQVIHPPFVFDVPSSVAIPLQSTQNTCIPPSFGLFYKHTIIMHLAVCNFLVNRIKYLNTILLWLIHSPFGFDSSHS